MAFVFFFGLFLFLVRFFYFLNLGAKAVTSIAGVALRTVIWQYHRLHGSVSVLPGLASAHTEAFGSRHDLPLWLWKAANMSCRSFCDCIWRCSVARMCCQRLSISWHHSTKEIYGRLTLVLRRRRRLNYAHANKGKMIFQFETTVTRESIASQCGCSSVLASLPEQTAHRRL